MDTTAMPPADAADAIGAFLRNEAKPPDADAIEVAPCVDDEGVVSRVDGESVPAAFWSAYYHRAGGGVSCIADFPTRAGAVHFAELVSAAWGELPIRIYE